MLGGPFMLEFPTRLKSKRACNGVKRALELPFAALRYREISARDLDWLGVLMGSC